MQPFTTLTGIAAPLPMINVDTDKIIPAHVAEDDQAHRASASALFETLRYDGERQERPEFVLNREPYRGAKILIAGDNFGCGSSREHAPWALLDFGIRCVIAPSFADIFYNNCFKNGILPIVLPQEQVDLLMKEAENAPDPTFTVDLEAQEIHRPTGNEPIPFDLDPGNRDKLLQGLDEIGETMRKATGSTASRPACGSSSPGYRGRRRPDASPAPQRIAALESASVKRTRWPSALSNAAHGSGDWDRSGVTLDLDWSRPARPPMLSGEARLTGPPELPPAGRRKR